MFLTQETPAKVFSLLGAAMFSMFLLFGVTLTNASFTGTETTLPDIFAPVNVTASLDNIANSYSKFVYANLLDQASQDYALAADNISFAIDEASPAILHYTGLSQLGQYEHQNKFLAKVAGAHTEKVSYSSVNQSLSLDTMYNVLVGEH